MKSVKKPMFIVTKLGRKANAESPLGNVRSGIQNCGCASSAYVPSERFINQINILAKDPTDAKALSIIERMTWSDKWKQQLDFEPKIGFPVIFSGNKLSAGSVRTSDVRSYYKHEAESSDHPDKLVLPAEFDKEDLLNMEFPVMQKGDYLLCNANSIYYCQHTDNVKPYRDEN